MPTSRCLSAAALAVAALVAITGTALANSHEDDPVQDPSPQSAAAAAEPQQEPEPEQQDEDRVMQPAEPDFRLINLPTTMRLPAHGGNFDLTHRFAGNLAHTTFGKAAGGLFGIDEGAVVGFEFRFGVMRHLEAAAYRSAFQRTIQLHSKYDAVHQGTSRPFSISALVSVEGTDNFRTGHAPALGAVASRTFGEAVAVYAVPVWVHNSAASLGVVRETFFMGVGGRVRFRRTLYLVAEISPRLAGYVAGKPEFGYGLEKRVGRHVFQLNFTNSSGTTFAQVARGGAPETLYLGFNLARKFF